MFARGSRNEAMATIELLVDAIDNHLSVSAWLPGFTKYPGDVFVTSWSLIHSPGSYDFEVEVEAGGDS
jgi:hypothetical protein